MEAVLFHNQYLVAFHFRFLALANNHLRTGADKGNPTVFFKALRRRETAGPSLEWHTIASKKENFPS